MIVRSLYEEAADSGTGPVRWGMPEEEVFQEIKRLLVSVPTLRLPDIT